jgi:hypothetical protein
MKTIQETYDQYQIPPNLAQHQLRVAGVVSWILYNWHGQPLDKEKIITAALFHDMGNIIKFDFSKEHTPFPYTDEERTYWQSVKEVFIQKYGNDPHHATQVIVTELGNPHGIAPIVGGLGFRNAPKFLASGDIVSMIIQYADMRVSPHAVTSAKERIVDFYKRYEHRPDFDALYPEREEVKAAIFKIEAILVKNTNLELLSITEDTIKGRMVELAQKTLPV